MAVPFHTQLQPFEENQSPSPTEERDNPYELALHRSGSPSQYSRSPKRSLSSASNHAPTSPPRGPPSPIDTVNTLQRQLSGDPENPPPPWQRRPSVSTQRSRGSSVNSHTRSVRSPSDSSTSPPPIASQPPSASRRHPNLKMTASSMRPPLPNAMFLNESPSGSSSSLVDDPMLTLPQPAFRRRKGGSNRSSIHSSQDLSSLTSEELWSLEQETGVSGNNAADMSNPLTRSQERPLDTVRRMSSRIEHSPYRTGLPQDVIWPTAPPDDLYNPPVKSRSVTSMVSLRSTSRQKRMSRHGSRQPSIDTSNIPGKLVDGTPYNKSTPTSPQDAVLISSTNSSSTSLASHNLPPNKSNLSLGSRPPSSFQSQLYQSRDILSALAPREGGYAIAAQMANGVGAVGSMSVEERRRSALYDGERPRSMARAPMSRSSGMGRWSLDGGEHYGKPYGTPSNATTATSISGRTLSSHEVSPPVDDELGKSSYLPDGASPPVAPRSTPNDASLPPTLPIQANSTPVNPSPLSQNTAAGDLPSPAPLPQTNAYPLSSPAPEAAVAVVSTSSPSAPPAVAPLAVPATSGTPPAPSPLNTKKSKKDLAKDAKAAAKEAKAAEKAAAAKAALQRAKDARDAAAKRQAEKDAAKKKKEDDKRREKEEKAQRKAEKKAGLKTKLKNSSVVGFQSSNSTTPSANGMTPRTTNAPPVPPVPAQHNAPPPVPAEFGAKADAVPFPRSQTSQKVPKAEMDRPGTNATSLPLGAMASTPTAASSAAPTGPAGPVQTASTSRGSTKPRLGMFGTLKKRLSFFGDDKTTPNSPTVRGAPVKANEALPPVPPTPQKYAQPSSPAQPATPVTREPEVVPVSATTPPRPTAIATASPEPLSILPPRSSSRPESVLLTTSNLTSPQTLHTAAPNTPTAPGIQRSNSHTPTSPTASPSSTHASPLTKTVSHGDHTSRTGSPASVRKGGSIRGPRPMPRSSPSPEKARPASIFTSDLQQHQVPSGSSSAVYASAITPSTSRESAENGDDSLFSHTISKESSAGTDLASPFTSVGGNGDSEKGSFNLMGDEREPPEREGSNETVTVGEKASEGVPAVTAIPVQAH